LNILFGHPTGNPNSHHAALAHLEAGRLEAFCVPWMPSATTLRILETVPFLCQMSRRLARRHFAPLLAATKIQDRVGESRRLLTRAIGYGDERLAYQANDWLMRTMSRTCRRPSVSVVHAYEDCSLWQFTEAKRLGKACIYDMPIGYYPAWEQIEADLVRKFSDWLPTEALRRNRYVRPAQKRQEMDLADLVLVPSGFVAKTIAKFYPDKAVALAPYGMDTMEWAPPADRPHDIMTFLFAGSCSLRKGVPLLLEAWRAAELKHARLRLVGSWQLAKVKQNTLPPRAEWHGTLAKDELRNYYREADVFVLPTYFEGRALVIGEALASGLPILTTPNSGAEDLIDETCGRLVPTGNMDALVECLRWFEKNHDRLPALRRGARARAEQCTWENYRRRVTEAITPFV
jgi:starch synthase